jgi:hypothetical protein
MCNAYIDDLIPVHVWDTYVCMLHVVLYYCIWFMYTYVHSSLLDYVHEFCLHIPLYDYLHRINACIPVQNLFWREESNNLARKSLPHVLRDSTCTMHMYVRVCTCM